MLYIAFCITAAAGFRLCVGISVDYLIIQEFYLALYTLYKIL